jgi:hypothetical protein
MGRDETVAARVMPEIVSNVPDRMKRAKALLELSRDCEMIAKSRTWVHELNASPIGGRE